MRVPWDRWGSSRECTGMCYTTGARCRAGPPGRGSVSTTENAASAAVPASPLEPELLPPIDPTSTGRGHWHARALADLA